MLITNPTQETFLEKSGWLDDVSPEERVVIFDDFSRRYDGWLEKYIQHFGEPDVTSSSEPQLARELYLEATRLAAWQKGDGHLVLALGQHDKETPVFVSFGFKS